MVNVKTAYAWAKPELTAIGSMTTKTNSLQRALGWCSECSDLQGMFAVLLLNHVGIYRTSKE